MFTHNEVTGKLCPLYYVNHPEAWAQFKDDVQNYTAGSGLKPGMINLTVDGVNYPIEAENRGGYFYTSLKNLSEAAGDEAKACIRAVLEANGYTVVWNADLLRITARKNKNADFHEIKTML